MLQRDQRAVALRHQFESEADRAVRWVEDLRQDHLGPPWLVLLDDFAAYPFQRWDGDRMQSDPVRARAGARVWQQTGSYVSEERRQRRQDEFARRNQL